VNRNLLAQHLLQRNRDMFLTHQPSSTLSGNHPNLGNDYHPSLNFPGNQFPDGFLHRTTPGSEVDIFPFDTEECPSRSPVTGLP
jgi:hypothetical protein